MFALQKISMDERAIVNEFKAISYLQCRAIMGVGVRDYGVHHHADRPDGGFRSDACGMGMCGLQFWWETTICLGDSIYHRVIHLVNVVD